MKNQDFIITSLQPWDIEIGSTIKNTALEISRNNRVIYVSTPIDYSTWIKGGKSAANTHRMNVINRKVPAIRQINKNMWIVDCPFMLYPVNQLPFTSLFDMVNRWNNKKIANRILEVVKEFDFKDYIHLIDTDIYRSQYLKEFLKPRLSIYYCRDFVVGDAYWKKNGTRLEPLLAAKSDVVLTNSTHFAERFKVYNKETHPIETGVNLELYNPSKPLEIPEELAKIPHPIIGYIGSINSTRLNADLLLNLARRCPQYNFVFTGPEDDCFSKHALHQEKNVFFLGKKTVDVLPAYIEGYDVCINPQTVNDVTDGNYPLKIDEYLAMGKPTVATSTHTMRDVFAEYTFLPANEEEYIKAFEMALKEVGNITKKEARIAFAKTHGWEQSVQKIYNIMQKYLD